MSKSGAYFYLIIDRTADGDQTAHFLNMVDEPDPDADYREDEEE